MPDYSCHGVISRLPHFTAIYFNEHFPGRHDGVEFNLDGTAHIAHDSNWVKRYADPELEVGAKAEAENVEHARLAFVHTSKPKSRIKMAGAEAARKIAREAYQDTIAPSGFIDTSVWTDSRGRTICVDGAQIRVDGVVVLDTQEDTFTAVESGYTFERL